MADEQNEYTLESGYHLHFQSAGEGAVRTVLVHGWGTTSNIWSSVLSRWPLGAGRVIALDLRGVGWSSKPADGYTLQGWADDLTGVLAQLPEPPILVGHSMGGTICQLLATQHPALIRRLVLVSPVPAGGVPLSDADVAYFRSLAGHRAGMASVLRSMMAAPPAESVVEQLISDSASVLPAAFIQGLDAWRAADFADRLADIQAPTAVLGGALEQPLTPDILQAAVVALIPGATFTLLPGVGHYPQLESPDHFTDTLLRACQLS
ncbi:MAG: non-heme chloroperoxidase [Myxococcota bacterium]|jgi:non-heme chloroperoxidase